MSGVTAAVERLHPRLRRLAKKVARSSRDDLVDEVAQEMALALLECEPGNTDSWYLQQAEFQGRNFLLRDRAQRRLVLNFTDVGLTPMAEAEDEERRSPTWGN